MPSHQSTFPKKQISSSHHRTTVTAATLGLLLLNASTLQIKAEMPVQVYILMGQSNMLGFGGVTGGINGKLDYAVNNKGLYQYLSNGAGGWATRNDVRNIRLQGSGGQTPGQTGTVHVNNWLTVTGLNTIGPEFGIGHHLGEAIDAPVILLKSCIGNRALGWDLLPPGSVQYDHTDGYTYPGSGGSPERWLTGSTPVPIGWYAGLQYEGDVSRAKAVLANLGTYYPGATEYVIAGFFWWQGDRDRYMDGHASRYEQNLVQLIEQLRIEFDAPEAKFVCATLGQTQIGETGNDGLILDAQIAVDGDTGIYPQFAGNVATVYSNPLSQGGASNNHYSGNAETYMNVGEAMGQAMVNMTSLFANWISGYSLVDASANGDDDGDGLPNGIEGLFGTSPDVVNAGLTPISQSGSTVTFAHPNPDAGDVLLDVTGSYEWSLNCATWYKSDGVEGPGGTTITTSATPNTPSANVTTVEATIAGVVPDELFMRVVATQN